MPHILAEIAPLKVSDGSRPVLRASSAQDRRLNGVAGQRWWPAIAKRPTLSIPLFDGDFSDDIEPGGAAFSLRLDALSNLDADVRAYRWAGAQVSLYAIDSAAPLNASGSYTVADLASAVIFKGRIESFGIDGNGLTLSATVDQEPFRKDVLQQAYAGTGDAEGGEDLKGRLKPWIFGRALNVEPVLINGVDNILQFSAYAIQGVSALYERGASFGPSIGNYGTYAALAAANIPAGRWASCHALGLVRLGAPPAGLITGDVDGDNGGGFVRTTGAIITRIATVLGISPSVVDAGSLAALDAAVPYPVNIVISDQTSFIDLARRLARPCNGQAGVDLLGRLFVTRPQIGTPALVLDAQGRRMPPVRKCTEADVSPPYKRIMFGAARCWRVHTFDEIAFDAPLIDRGEYDAATVYRRGNIVSLPNGSRWLYVSDTPKSGSMPSDDNEDWESLSGPITAGNITYEDGTLVETLKPAGPGATRGAPDGTHVGDITAADVTDALKAVALTTDPAEVVEGARALVDRARSDAWAALRQLVLGQERKERFDRLTHLDGIGVGARVRTEIAQRIEGQKALVDWARGADWAALQQLVLSQERKERFDRLTHLDGIEVGARVRTEITERIEGQEAQAQRSDTIEAKVETNRTEAVAALQAEEIARVSADLAETTERTLAIASLQTSLDGQIATVVAAIAAEAVTRATEDAAETTARELAISQIHSDMGDVVAALEAEATTRATAISAETAQREAAISSVQTSLDGAVTTLEGAITAEATTRAADDAAETIAREVAVSTVQTNLNGAVTTLQGQITAEASTRASDDQAETAAREAAISQIQGEIGDVAALIASEATTRASADAAETLAREAAISTVQSNLDGAVTTLEAAIAAEATTRADAISAEVATRSAQIASLTGDIDDVNAALTAETNARVTAISAETTAREAAISALSSDIVDANAAITAEATTRATAISAEATARAAQIASLESDIVDVNAAITAEATTRATEIAAETAARELAISTLDTAVDGQIAIVTAGIASEATTRATEIAAETAARALAISALQSDIGDVETSIFNEATTRASADAAETAARELAISTVQSSLDDEVAALEAAIAAEATTRATAISAEATTRSAQIASLQSDIVDVNAAITAEATTRATAISAETSAREAAVSTLGSDIVTVSGMVAAETATRVSEDAALASAISGVETTVGGHTASITALSESVDGVLLRYGLNLNSNDHIIGFLANNDGKSGGFDFVVDYFRIWDASGTISQAPFDYSGGVLKMANVEVDTIKAGTGNSAQFGNASATASVSGTGMGNLHTVLSKTVTLLRPGFIQATAALAIGYTGPIANSGLHLVINGSRVFSVGGATTEISVVLANSVFLAAGTYDVEIDFEGPTNMSVEGRNLSTVIIYT